MTRSEIKEIEQELKALKEKHKTLSDKYSKLNKVDLDELQNTISILEDENEQFREENDKMEKELQQKKVVRDQFGYDEIIELPKSTSETLESNKEILIKLQEQLNMKRESVQNILQTVVAIYEVDTEKYNVNLSDDNKMLLLSEKE